MGRRCSVRSVVLLAAAGVHEVAEEVVIVEVRVVDESLEVEGDFCRAQFGQFGHVAGAQFRVLEVLLDSEGRDGGRGLDGRLRRRRHRRVWAAARHHVLVVTEVHLVVRLLVVVVVVDVAEDAVDRLL